MCSDHRPLSQVDSGVSGLDELLRGGYTRGRMYLLTGEPGTGKTALGYHFLEAGLDAGDDVLYIHGEEAQDELLANAERLDIDIADAAFLDLGPGTDFFTEAPTYDLVDPVDIEETQHTAEIHDAIREIDPDRVVIDPITQLQYTEASAYHFRQRLLAFMRFLKGRGTTVLATATPDDRGGTAGIRSLSDGVILISQVGDGRRIEVQKNRGFGQRTGDHGLEIHAGGVEVFPGLVQEPTDRAFDPTPIRSGIDELDTLVGGGLERGTVTFISGPPGVGKTTIGTVYLAQAASEGEKATIYLFEERIETFRHRCQSIGVPIDSLCESGQLTIRVIDPGALSAEEFAHRVRADVDAGTRLVMIDGIGGYTSAIQGDTETLDRDLHVLTRYLVNREVSVFVTDEVHRITGLSAATSRAISPIADNILVLSYVERDERLGKVIGVLKKRVGTFEQTFRALDIDEGGVHVDTALTGIGGLFSDVTSSEPLGRTEDGT